MGASCLYSPLDSNGKEYKALPKYRGSLGQKAGTLAFLKALSPSFQKRHKGKLEIDNQGVATFETVILIPEIKKMIGGEKVREALERDNGFIAVDNNSGNFRMLLDSSKNFNDSHSDYIAYPEIENGKIRNVVHERNENTVKAFNDMYGTMMLNDRLADIFSPLGVTADDLLETERGYSGITDFSKAKDVAGNFAGLIRIANNMQGQMSMSEEFSHLIVRILRDSPLMQRVLNNLMDNTGRMQEILGDSYADYVNEATDSEGNVDYSMVAEECAGRLLRDSLMKTMETENKSFLQKLMDRIVNLIKKIFKGFNEEDVNQAVLDADQTLDDLAKNLLKGNVEITKNDIRKTFSDEKMHHLEENVDALNDIIEKAIAVEHKKLKMIKSDKAEEFAEKKIKNLEAILNQSPAGKLKGIINYAKSAVYDLGRAREALLNMDGDDTDFNKLRGIWSTIKSYSNLIDQLADIRSITEEEMQKLIRETEVEDKNHDKHTLHTVFDDLASLYKLVERDYKNKALKSVEEFFKPFFDVDGNFSKVAGDDVTLRKLIEEADKDIGFMDKYFLTMSSSGDMLLQLFDEVVKKAKAQARYNTIDDINDITRLMIEAKERGITDFSWIFERDAEGKKTGNYISEVNYGKFVHDRDEFLESLDEEYGKNPHGDKAREKVAKKKEWMDKNSKQYGSQPNPDVYHNDAFDEMSKDPNKKYVYDKFMELKQKFDARLPKSKVSTFKAVQMRRTAQQRFLNSISDPMQACKNIEESIKNELTVTEDDDAKYGGSPTGLRSFDGSEFMVLPVLYTQRLSNPEELTDDIFSSLAAYSYSTNVYKEMDDIVDPLEVARSYIKENRKYKKTLNGKTLVERVTKSITNTIFGNEKANYEDKLDNFMDSQVYGRYYADADDTIKILGKEFRKNKLVSKWLSLTSTVQLGFNWLTNSANVATGIAMQNIEAFCGHYFSAKELADADKEYLKELVPFVTEVEAKNITNKLALFDRLFDVKQEFDSKNKEMMNTLFEKVFGKSWAFLGQNCGDHWLYNRTAIAMCIRQKVRLADGTETNLWEALKPVNAFDDRDDIKKLDIDAYDIKTGEKIDREYIRRLSEKINEINHRLFGVYNTDDMVMAQRYAMGRCLLQFRQWMAPMFARRFQDRKYITALGEWEEGYYITTMHLLAGLRNGMEGLKQVWADLDSEQRKNVWRTLVEVLQFGLVASLASFCSFGKDDPDRIWVLKFAEYMAQREKHELGNLTPSLTMGNEILKTVKSPAVILNTTQSTLNLIGSLLDPRDWNDDIGSGKYKGHSTLYKHIMKAPIPIISPFNQIDRFSDSIEESTRYYTRGY